jgi:hypothetical protein
MIRLAELAALGGIAVIGAACLVDDADLAGLDPADVAHENLGPGDRVVGANGLSVIAPDPGERVTAIVDGSDGVVDMLVVETLDSGIVVERARPEAPTDSGVVAPRDPPPGAVMAATLSPSCGDNAFSTLGFRWTTAVPWFYSTTVDEVGISDAAGQQVIDQAMRYVTTTYNPCGLADEVSATATYRGTTTARPGLDTAAHCTARDSISAMGFGDLPSGTVGATCTWSRSGRALESDVALNATDFAIYLSEPASCSGRRYSARAVATHEWGHVFGLGHVTESGHGSLTMSTVLTSCSDDTISLGLGDILGLRSLY